ncbi:nucleotidyl transferase AbiEii/AbiGii toxin family protein [Candidatus Bathycorpusculum sp.]|uniref:nucleotidyl transferase AbiEii/AbiGii toxin family protein n=1 Tax=Candidatus Bathycorpusculum sp. TaxID=2994959 RepID=UPI002817661D|nr:nucleotidyl transferase AbiEii/AbiGii toxin family protein [Candidatus Termitimicrobium sp.]
MRKEFVVTIAEQNGIEQTELIEKDVILHQILTDLSKNESFFDNFVFKGGTCLTKCHLGYYRFSEDIDFTWKNQEIFENISQKQIRKNLSNIINTTGSIFEAIADKRGLDFKHDKQNRRYVELGGSNKICTFKLWYTPCNFNVESFVKVQMNFVEKIHFTPQIGTLNALPCKKSEELSFLFSDYTEYFQTINMYVYDTREILCEKVRSVLTRKGVKARDFLDIYLLCKKYNLKLEDLLELIVDKICFTLDIYQKYREHFETKKIVVGLESFTWGKEEKLLLQKVEQEPFREFLDDFQGFLKKVIEKIPSS